MKYIRSLGVKAGYKGESKKKVIRENVGDPSYRERTNDAFKFGAIARTRKGACTVIGRLFQRSNDIVAWPYAAAICTLCKVSEVIQRSRRNKR